MALSTCPMIILSYLGVQTGNPETPNSRRLQQIERRLDEISGLLRSATNFHVMSEITY